MPQAHTGKGNLVVDLTAIGLPEVPLVGRVQMRKAGHPLRPHLHPGAYEICYLLEGMQVFSVDGRDHLMRAGDIFLTLPNEEHGTGRHPRECSCLYWAQVVPPRNGPFLSLSNNASNALRDQLKKFGSRRLFPAEAALDGLFDRVISTAGGYLAESPIDPFVTLQVSTWMQELLVTVIRSASSSSASKPTSRINHVLEYIEKSLEEPLSVDSLAQVARLSVPRFKARFKQDVGLPPAKYVLRQKIARARELLATGMHSVTDVAFMLGFSSSQNFATCFKRVTNKRPGHYLLKHEDKA